MKLKELRQQRGEAVHQMNAILEVASAEKRDLSTEEKITYDKLFDKQEALKGDIERTERQLELNREFAEKAERSQVTKPSGAPKTEEELRSIAFRTFLRTGKAHGEGAEELRALSAQSGVEGGYLVAPQLFVTDLIKTIDNLVSIRRLATKYQVGSNESLGAPSLDADPADADWTAELLTGNEDSSMAFGKRELKPHALAKRIKVSKKLLRNSVMPIEALIMERLGYKFAVTEEKAFLTGSGANQPLGVFTASDNGIATSRDVSTGNTSTAITADGLLEAKYSLKSGYLAKASWMFHRDALKNIAKLKDGENRYLWQASLVEGQPDRLLNQPVISSEYAPNTFTSGLYVGLIGDFSYYWIADALNMQVQKLVELYAETNQDGFIGRMECDGMPVLGEAFARVKLA